MLPWSWSWYLEEGREEDPAEFESLADRVDLINLRC